MTDIQAIARRLLAGALANGGATVPLNDEPVPSTGFMVGGLAPEWSAPADVLTIRRVRDFVNVHQNARFLGSWVEGDRVVFDVSEHFDTWLDALLAARARGEREVYDLANQTSIKV